MGVRKKKPSPEEMRKLISSFCGRFKLKPGEKSVVQELIEERRKEKELEEKRFRRFAALGKRTS